MNKILLTLSALFLFGNGYAQLSASTADDYTKVGIKYVVTWSAHHKLTMDRPNIYGQFPLYEYDKEYSISFSNKTDASNFIAGFTAAASSTGTLTTLGTPKIVIINTTLDK